MSILYLDLILDLYIEALGRGRTVVFIIQHYSALAGVPCIELALHALCSIGLIICGVSAR